MTGAPVLAVDWTLVGNRSVLTAAALTAVLYIGRRVVLPTVRLVAWWDRYGVKAMARIEAEMSNNGGASVKDAVERIEQKTEQKTGMAEANSKRLERMDGRLTSLGTKLTRLERKVDEHMEAHR